MSIKTQKNHYMFVRPEPSVLHPDLTQSLQPIENAYQEYLDEINDKEIILYDEDAPDDRFLVLPYRTRFNDRHRQLCNLDEFEAKFTEAEKYYDVAVFLTLTTAPGMHPNLWWANRHMAPAFNRYMSYLTKKNIIAFKADIAKDDAAKMKKNGYSDDEIKMYQKSHGYRRYLKKQVASSGLSFRPRYICCNEFQENGLIHLHLLIFGKSWLALKSQIEEDWARCGQGRIIDVYTVRKTAPGNWVWANPKRKPADAKGDQDAKKYLKKYLNKAIYDQRGFEHYFTVNKRFFTASRNMSPAKQVRSQGQPAPAPLTEPVDYVRDETKPRWRFGGAVASSNVINQIRYIADRCRLKFCRPSIDLNSGPPPVPSPWVEAAEMDQATRRRRRDSPILRFVPASQLPRSGAAEPEINPKTGKPFTLADFM